MINISEISQFVTHVHAKYRSNSDGEVATYIPELGKADPDHFAISVVTVDGQEFSVGDSHIEFTIQSICKPVAFLMALGQHGRQKTLSHVGVEPSGDPFNSVALNPRTNLPYNAMVNAGAIAVASLIKGESPATGDAEFLRLLGLAAGRQLRIDHSVYASEAATGDRNRAIAYLLRNFKVIDESVEHTLHQYFSQCSVLANTRDLAMIGATMANLGENPESHKEVFDSDSVRDTLSIMFTCGMYDFAGEWAFRSGMPAKSGVSGGILAVVNRQIGIAVYSPRLDERGNSVRGIQVCADLSDEFGLHCFNFSNFGSSLLRVL
jgi:glutaminase